MTKSDEIRKILKSMHDDGLAQVWSTNDIIIKKIAISHDEMMLDTGDNLELAGFVCFSLETQRLADSNGEKFM